MQKKLELLQKLSDSKKVFNELLQDEEFDYFSLEKKRETDAKLARIGISKVTRVMVSDILKHGRAINGERKFEYLPKDFYDDPDSSKYEGAVLLLTNNDIGPNLPKYVDFYRRNPNAVFVIWDWDPQHWTYMSCMLAMHCEFYSAAASENAYLFSHFNPYVLGPVFFGVNQWSRQFILEHIDVLLAERSNEPLGEHAYYPDFPRRNRAIQTVTVKCPGVGFSDHSYTKKSDLENLQIWAGAKVHWIMPVLSGMPVRVHNAILTGGIPVLPAFYKNIPEIQTMGDIPLYYDTIDLVEPARINQLAIEKFDRAGKDGLLARVTESMSRNHVDPRMEELFRLVDDKLVQLKNDTRDYNLGYFRQT